MLLDSGVIGLVISLKFVKNKLKLKKIKKPIYMRNVNGMFNKKRSIEHTVEVNIYYQRYEKWTEINVISRQKQNIILEIPWLIYHNPKINWRTKEVKITRYLDECGKQQRPK